MSKTSRSCGKATATKAFNDAFDVGKETGKHMGMSTTYLTATTRTSLVWMPLYFGESLGMVAMMVASREARKASSNVKSAANTTMHNTTVDTHEAVHCWWIFLNMNLVMKVCEAKMVVCFRSCGLCKQTARSLKALADSNCRSDQLAELARRLSCESSWSLWVERKVCISIKSKNQSVVCTSEQE